MRLDMLENVDLLHHGLNNTTLSVHIFNFEPSQWFAKELNGAAPEAICSACSRAMRAIPSCHRNGGRPWTVKPDWNVEKWTDTTGNKTATFWIVPGNIQYSIETSLTSCKQELLQKIGFIMSYMFSPLKQVFIFCDLRPRYLEVLPTPNLWGSIAIGTI